MGKYKINGIQTKKKNNLKFMVLVIFLISLIMCISSFGIATWARYRTNTNGGVEAQIAKWSFKVNGEEEQFADINLADTIDFTHVATDKIAPGTNGSFDLVIDGSGSEVSLDYYINVNVTGKPTNLKFYTDSQYTTELPIVNNKFSIEDEILLPNINTPVTKTIYWKWDYRTSNMPSQEKLDNYVQDIDGLQVLLNEYNAVGKTAEQKQEIVLKINDKIDTHEEGGEVVLGVSVVGIQKHPEGFIFKSVQVTSTTDERYIAGEEVTLEMDFTEGVYADNNQTQITNATAPTLNLEFDGITQAENSLVAKVASRTGNILKIAEANNYKTATFVEATQNKLKYSYTIQNDDSGSMKIAGMSGTVYNRKGQSIQLEKKSLTGDTIVVNQNAIKASNWQEKGNSDDAFTEANQLLGTAGGRSYYKSNDVPAIAIAYYNGGARYALISTTPQGTIGYCDINSNADNSQEPYQTIKIDDITWYVRELPGGFSDGTTATSNNCDDVGTVTSVTQAVQTGVSNYYNPEKVVHTLGLVLFDNGNQCESVTGGWYGYYADGTNQDVGSVTIGNCLDVNTWGTWCRYCCETRNSIDLTEYSTLVVEYEQVTNNSIGIVINSWIDLSLTGGNNVTFEYDITRFGVVNKFGLTACNGGRCVVKKIYLLK